MTTEQYLSTFTSQQLRDLHELYSWDRATLCDQPEPDFYEAEGCAYFDHHLGAIERVLAHRARLTRQYGTNRDLTHSPITRERFEAVKRAVTVSDYLWAQGYGEPKRSGERRLIRCMLDIHPNDDTPSFTIYPDDRGWYCFGCGQGGSVIDLAMMLGKHYDARDALRAIEEVYKLTYVREADLRQAITRVDAAIARHR